MARILAIGTATLDFIFTLEHYPQFDWVHFEGRHGVEMVRMVCRVREARPGLSDYGFP